MFNIALLREQTRDIDRTLHTLATATGVDEAALRETVNRRRREPSYRPIVLIENATREQLVAFMARQWELPGIIRPGSSDAQISAGRSRRASVRLRGRSHRITVDATGIQGRRVRRRRRTGGRRTGLQPVSDGRRWRSFCRRQQSRPRARRSWYEAAGRRPTAAIDHRRRFAEGGRRWVPLFRIQRRGGRAGSSVGRGALARQPSRLRSEPVRRRDRPCDLVGAEYGQAPSPAESRTAGSLLAGIDVQDRRGDRRARGGRCIAGLPCQLCWRRRRSSAVTFSAI